MSRKIEFNFDDWKLKVENRKRDRMKITFKLNKDETIGFRDFTETIKPKEVSDEQFYKTIFLTGIETLNIQFTEAAKRYIEEAKQKKAAEEEGKDLGNIQVLKGPGSEPSDVVEVERDEQ